MTVKGATYIETFQMYQQGFSLDEIAAKRELSPDTILGHFSHLYEKGENINIKKFVGKTDMGRIVEQVKNMEQPYRLKEIFDSLNEEVSYGKIKLALSYLESKKMI